ITVQREMRAEEAAKLMADSKVKKLPAVDYGKLVGMVTQTDLVAASFSLVTSLKQMVRVRYSPPDFEPLLPEDSKSAGISESSPRANHRAG
ncbi:MAG: CBS domain-containing protein, partial [Thaumarchaeota archaeon]|nr:CBS domain-containing protein [Nitrososphaerota archaeon]